MNKRIYNFFVMVVTFILYLFTSAICYFVPYLLWSEPNPTNSGIFWFIVFVSYIIGISISLPFINKLEEKLLKYE